MAVSPRITADMTVREISLRYPACRMVFNRYGLGGCGGEYGPAEPLDFFARAHHADLDELLHDLEDAAARGETPPAEAVDPAAQVVAENAAVKLHRLFVKAALVMTLTLGTGFGVYKLTRIAMAQSFDPTSYAGRTYAGTQAHGHAQLFGWVGLFIMGVAYFAIPRFMNATLPRPRVAYASFWLMFLGILLRSSVQPHGAYEPLGSLMVLGGIAELAAALIFAWIMVETLAANAGRREPFEKFLAAGVVWFVLSMAANLWFSWLMRARVDPIVPAAYNGRFLDMVLLGFVTNTIFGTSLRILPNFLGLRQPLDRPSCAALVLFNAGVIADVAGLPPVLASALLLVGAMIFVHALGIFTRTIVRLDIPGVDPAFGWFVRLAYGWLLVTVLMVFGAALYTASTGAPVPHEYVGAYRHAITVGFISTMIFGVGYRVLPIFSGTDLKMPWAIRTTFFLILVGNIMRVGFQLATLSGNTIFYALMGSSGYIELVAMGIFSVSIWRTMREQKDPFLEDHIVRPNTKVANILDLYPGARVVLVSGGLHHLAKIARPPGFVTLGFAARRHGLDPDQLAAMLNDFIKDVHREEVRVG